MKKYIFIALSLVSILSFNSCNFVNDGVATAHKEYDPSAMLKKYEWFKNQSEYILKMDKDIANAKTLRDQVRAQFEGDNGKDHSKWDPITKSQYQEKVNLQDQMVLATVAQRNTIVADYNAQSSKFNWEPFKSKTDLPATSFEEIK